MDRYIISSEETSKIGFDVDNWTGAGTRTINQNGTITLSYGTSINHQYNIPFPDTNWILSMDMTFNNSGNINIRYNNTVNGHTVLRLASNNNTTVEEQEVISGSQTTTKTTTLPNKLVTSENKVNTLQIARYGKKIQFKYISPENYEEVVYEREYDALNTNGNLFIQVANGSSLTFDNILFLTLANGGGGV